LHFYQALVALASFKSVLAELPLLDCFRFELLVNPALPNAMQFSRRTAWIQLRVGFIPVVGYQERSKPAFIAGLQELN